MKHAKYYLLVFFLVLADHASKALLYGKNYDLWLVSITFIRNTGISFGLLQGSNYVIALVSVAVLAGLWYYRKEFKGKEFWVLLMVSGIIGNLLDRVLRGYVVDFIDFKIWPVFNFADAYLFVGVIGIIFLAIKEEYYKGKH